MFGVLAMMAWHTPLPLSFCDDDALEELVRVTGLVLYPQAPRNGWASIYNADDSDYIFPLGGPCHLCRRRPEGETQPSPALSA